MLTKTQSLSVLFQGLPKSRALAALKACKGDAMGAAVSPHRHHQHVGDADHQFSSAHDDRHARSTATSMMCRVMTMMKAMMEKSSGSREVLPMHHRKVA